MNIKMSSSIRFYIPAEKHSLLHSAMFTHDFNYLHKGNKNIVFELSVYDNFKDFVKMDEINKFDFTVLNFGDINDIDKRIVLDAIQTLYATNADVCIGLDASNALSQFNRYNLIRRKYTAGCFIYRTDYIKDILKYFVNFEDLIYYFSETFKKVQIKYEISKSKIDFDFKNETMKCEKDKCVVLALSRDIENITECFKDVEKFGCNTILAYNENDSHKFDEYCNKNKITPYKYSYDFNYSKIHNEVVNRHCENYDYLLSLNDDTIFDLEIIDKMFDTVMYRDVAVVGAKLLYPDGTIQHMGISFDNAGRPYHINNGKESDFESSNYFVEQKAVTFAIVCLNLQIYRSIGGLDERMHLDYNDVDYCLRCYRDRKFIVYNPEATAIHKESITRTKYSKMDRDNNSNNNLKLFFEKNRGIIKK